MVGSPLGITPRGQRKCRALSSSEASCKSCRILSPLKVSTMTGLPFNVPPSTVMVPSYSSTYSRVRSFRLVLPIQGHIEGLVSKSVSDCLHWKRCSEHRQPTLGLFPGCFVLQDVPVLSEYAVGDA